MMDEGDLAKARAEEATADALADWQRRQPTGPGLSHCIDCEEEIPLRRRQALPGAVRCIDCQTVYEKGGKA